MAHKLRLGEKVRITWPDNPDMIGRIVDTQGHKRCVLGPFGSGCYYRYGVKFPDSSKQIYFKATELARVDEAIEKQNGS